MSDFVVTSTITYRPFRVPPRCRKPRPVIEKFTHEYRIPSVSSDEAPVVALVPDDRGYFGAPVGEDAPLRAYQGQLYIAESNGRTPVRAGSDAFKAKRAHESWQAGQDEAIAEAGRGFQDVLIVDGEIWKPTVEPSYAIVTMGLGGNHGGTYLEIDYQGRYSRQFPLTDYDNAVEAAVAFATTRGDTNTIGIIRNTPRATILDPAAFKIPAEAQSRAAAEAEVRALAEQARELLSGPLTRTRIGTIKDLLETAANRFWEHGLEEVPAVEAGPEPGSKIED